MSRLRVHEVKIVNSRDIDIYITDAFGKTHTLFPHAEKTITTITETAYRRPLGSEVPKPQQEK